jgi:hypothetical protein
LYEGKSVARYYDSVQVCPTCYAVYNLLDTARSILEDRTLGTPHKRRTGTPKNRSTGTPNNVEGAAKEIKKTKSSSEIFDRDREAEIANLAKANAVAPSKTWKDFVKKDKADENLSKPSNRLDRKKLGDLDNYLRKGKSWVDSLLFAREL